MSIATLGFNGQAHEPKSSWQFLGKGYRVYNPCLMRFHSQDVLSPFAKGGFNAYAYCAGDPVNNADPSGHFLLPVAALLGVGAVGMFGASIVTGVQGKNEQTAIFAAISGVLALAALGVVGRYAGVMRAPASMRAPARTPVSATAQTSRPAVKGLDVGFGKSSRAQVPVEASNRNVVVPEGIAPRPRNLTGFNQPSTSRAQTGVAKKAAAIRDPKLRERANSKARLWEELHS